MSGADLFSAVAADLATGTASAEALAEAALARIAAENDRSHIFISVDEAAARAAARASDARRKAGAALGPLDGMPVAIKDNIDVAGLATTDGTGFYRDRRPAADATVVARLKAAGAVLLGKVNMHEGALGATTDNPFWGRCENPLAAGHTPGGSSGGSGAVVAAGIAPLALGTDTMGSVRIPAAYCGVWGLKPTRGLFSNRGLSHLSWTLDTIGPIATGPAGLRAAAAVMAGADPDDRATALQPADWRAEADVPAALTLGLPDLAALAECEPAVRAGFDAYVERLRSAGVRLVPVTVPGWDPGKARRAGLIVSEAEGGALFGADLDRGGDGFSDEFRSLVNYGRSARGERVALAYRTLEELRTAALLTLREVDAILLPTAPQRAFPHGMPAPANQADLTALANIAGCPAVAFPLPAEDGGLPVSAQLVGPCWSEGRLIAMAEQIARFA